MHVIFLRDQDPAGRDNCPLRILLGGLLLAVLVGSTTPALAVDKFAAEFLKIGVGARPMGMGGSFVSLSDDATATFWNPAGLSQLEHNEAMGMHASQFGGVVVHDVLGIVAPLKFPDHRSAIGLTLVRLGVDDIKVTKDAGVDADGDGVVDEDANGNPIIDPQKIETRSAYDLALYLSYARSLGRKWSTGLNLKLVRQSLVNEGASFGIGADLGFLYRPSEKVGLGLRLSDITTTQLFWDTGRRETVAPTVTLGGHTTLPISALQGSLTLGLDLNFAFEGQEADQFSSGNLSGNLLAGAEYWFRQTVALRVGTDAGNFTAGGGVRYKQVGADYAYLSHDELDSTHRVSALVRF
jgi:hypothetical protein